MHFFVRSSRASRAPFALASPHLIAVVALACIVAGRTSRATDDNQWNQFRGPNGTGVAATLNLSDDFSLEDVRWKTAFGNGNSSIVVSDGKLFATSFSGTTRTLHCMNASSGDELWAKSIESSRTEVATPPNGPATCSPVCNDQLVCALFPDAALCVYTLDGQLLWTKDLGPFYSMHGISASPILVGDRLIVTIDQLQDPFVVAFNATTGEELWRVERLLGITGGYSTPALAAVGGRKLIVSASPGEMVGYDVTTGEKCLSVVGLTNAPVSIPVVVHDRVYYSEVPGEPIPMEALGNADKNGDGVIELTEVEGSVGTHRLIERIDSGFGNADGKVDKSEWYKGFGSFLNKGGLSCIQLHSAQDKIEANVVWKYTKTTPYIPSALELNGHIYVINDGGILICFDGEAGEILKRERLSDATGQYYASPVAAGDRIVLANLQGKLTLLRAGSDFQVLKTLDLEEPIVASPSIIDGRLYVRTKTHLYCFES